MPKRPNAPDNFSSKARSTLSRVSLAFSNTLSRASTTVSTVLSAISRVLDSNSSPTLTRLSNILPPSSSARENAPKPANQICCVYLRKSEAEVNLRGLSLIFLSFGIISPQKHTKYRTLKLKRGKNTSKPKNVACYHAHYW